MPVSNPPCLACETGQDCPCTVAIDWDADGTYDIGTRVGDVQRFVPPPGTFADTFATLLQNGGAAFTASNDVIVGTGDWYLLLADATTTVGDSQAASPAAQTNSLTTYQVQLSDLNRTIIHDHADPVVVTLPTDLADATIPAGHRSRHYAAGAGGLSLSTTGITLIGTAPGTSVETDEEITVEKVGADTWLVSGATHQLRNPGTTVHGITADTTAPTGPAVDDLWVDTT